MNKSLRTGLLHLNLGNTNFDVAHLYEHMLIETFKRSLEDHGISKYLFGWISGETFHDILFIEYGFYNPKTEQLFLDFMQSNSRINYNLLDIELERIQAEDSSIIVTIDKDAILSLLKKIDQLVFINHRDDFIPTKIRTPSNNSDSKILEMKRAKKQFREVAISFGIRDITSQDLQILLRLRPLVLDAIDTSLFNMGAYGIDTSLTACHPDLSLTFVISAYNIRRKGIALKQINEKIRKNIMGLADDIQKHSDEITDYMSGFVTTPNWHSFPIDYYRYTGMITSKNNIRKLFTPENIIALLAKLEISVTTATADHWDLLQKHS